MCLRIYLFLISFPLFFFQVLVITHYVKLIIMIHHMKHFPRGLGFYTNTLDNVAEVIKFTLNHSNMEDIPLIPSKYKSYKLQWLSDSGLLAKH